MKVSDVFRKLTGAISEMDVAVSDLDMLRAIVGQMSEIVRLDAAAARLPVTVRREPFMALLLPTDEGWCPHLYYKRAGSTTDFFVDAFHEGFVASFWFVSVDELCELRDALYAIPSSCLSQFEGG